MSRSSLPDEPNARRLSRAVGPVFIYGTLTVFVMAVALLLLIARSMASADRISELHRYAAEAGYLVAKGQASLNKSSEVQKGLSEAEIRDWSARLGNAFDSEGTPDLFAASKKLGDDLLAVAGNRKVDHLSENLSTDLEAVRKATDVAATASGSGLLLIYTGIPFLLFAMVAQALLTMRGIRWRLAIVVRAENREILEERDMAHAKELAIAGDKATMVIRAKQADLEAQAEALRMALSKAEEASLVKTAFLGNISHEIRTPLNGIVATSELLAQTQLDADQTDLVTTVITSGEQLTRIIQDILDLAQMEAGRLSLEIGPFDIGLLVQEIVMPYEALARAKGVEFFVHLPPEEERTVASDPMRVRQILMNMVSNAAKFTHKGRIDVRVETVANAGDMVELRLSVSDTGIGIEPARLPAIFERFSQGDNSSKRTYGGTGLGLTIAKQIVELLGGQIGVNSERGVGSHFWAAVPAQHATPESIPSHHAPIVTEIPHLGMKVLVAEDNLVNQKMMQRLLQRCACSVDLAENGAEAVEKAMFGNYDVILMDIHMPVMDGVEATVEIRRKEKAWQRRETPIIAVTADVMEERRRKFMESGMQDFVPKPVRLATLLPALERLASKSPVVKVGVS